MLREAESLVRGLPARAGHLAVMVDRGVPGGEEQHRRNVDERRLEQKVDGWRGGRTRGCQEPSDVEREPSVSSASTANMSRRCAGRGSRGQVAMTVATPSAQAMLTPTSSVCTTFTRWGST